MLSRAVDGRGRSSLDIEDGVGGVSGGLVLGGVTDESLLLGECDVRWGDTVSCEAESVRLLESGGCKQGQPRPWQDLPWSLTRISTLPFCITPTQE